MPLAVVGSVKGSPGATLTAAGLAAAWPETDRVLVEADPSGGDLAAQWRLRLRPGLIEVAALAEADDVDPSEALANGIQSASYAGAEFGVVCAPFGTLQTRGLVARLAVPGVQILNPARRWVVADCGRLAPGSAAWPLLSRADVVVVVIEGTVTQVAHVRGVIDALWTACGPRLAVVVRPSVYNADEITGVLRVTELPVAVLGNVPALPQGRKRRSNQQAWRTVAQAVLAHADRETVAALEAAEGREWS